MAWCRNCLLFNVVEDALPQVKRERAVVVEVMETTLDVPESEDVLNVQESAYKQHGRGEGQKVRLLSACFVKGDFKEGDKTSMDALRRLLLGKEG